MEGMPLLVRAALGHLLWEMNVGGHDSEQDLIPWLLWALLWVLLKPGPRPRVHADSILV